MKPFSSRNLLLVAFSVLLGACQSQPASQAELTDVRSPAIEQLEHSLASGELAAADEQLTALQAAPEQGSQLEPYQRQLAEAYLQHGQLALQKGDINTATTALSRARSLMPTAPALTGGVNNAIVQARKIELDQTEAALQAAEAKATAKLIDPSAESSTIILTLKPMARLRRQLDALAADVVNFQCDASIQTPRNEDYPWLATLLSKRVQKLAPDFDLKLEHRMIHQQPAQIVLTPRKP
jgi:hypothetical protein